MKHLITTIFAAALAISGCKTTDSGSDSTAKDFGNPTTSGPQDVTTLVPSGGSTTAMIALEFPIVSNGLEIHTTCDLQMAQFYATYDGGLVGALAPTADANVWIAPSGETHTWQAVQFVTNNFGAPAYCTYSVQAAGSGEADPIAAGVSN